MTKKKILIRYNVPTKYDRAPHGEVVKVITGMGDDEKYSHYVQTSGNEEMPNWIRMGDFLEESLENMFDNELFVDELMQKRNLLKFENKWFENK